MLRKLGNALAQPVPPQEYLSSARVGLVQKFIDSIQNLAVFRAIFVRCAGKLFGFAGGIDSYAFKNVSFTHSIESSWFWRIFLETDIHIERYFCEISFNALSSRAFNSRTISSSSMQPPSGSSLRAVGMCSKKGSMISISFIVHFR